ncbi:MAG: PEP-CTERM sorting domain-containing protein [Phycisphaerae bacterium]|nr:PEP-CTERM sorting domain-containing protein [Phycisphaerae bacterium]
MRRNSALFAVLGVQFVLCSNLLAAEMLGWGDNSWGQLSSPSGSSYQRAVAGETYTLTLDASGTLGVLGNHPIGDAIRDDIPDGEHFVAVSGKRGHALAQRIDGTLVGLGNDTFGQASPPLGAFTAFAAGSNHSLGIRPNGSLEAWGYGDFGQTAVPAGNNYVAVDGGEYHSIALRSDQTAVAWGWYNGAAYEVSNVAAIAAGWGHSLVLKTDGSLFAWGTNGQGEIDAPIGNDFVAVWAGGFVSAAMRSNGTYEVWGDTANGQDLIPGGIDPSTISISFTHGVALVPEPTSLWLLTLGALFIGRRR